jgi:hypothetical protein
MIVMAVIPAKRRHPQTKLRLGLAKDFALDQFLLREFVILR